MSEEYADLGAAGRAADRQPVGDTLRRAREARGETVGDVVNALKLTHRQVEAMEAGRFELLPGPAFVRGFVRNYGRHLGLDTATLLAGLEQDIAAPAVELAPVSNAEGIMPSGASARPAYRPAAAVVLVLILAVLAGWYFDWFKAPDSATTEAEAPAVEPSATVLAPAPQVLEHDAGSGDGAVAPGAPPPVESETLPPVAPPVAPAWEAAQTVAAPTVPVPAVPAPDTPVSSVAPEPAAPAGVEQLRFRLQGESWIEVRDGGGRILFSGVAPAGSTRTVQGKAPFAVVVGNAPQVAIEYRGRPVDLTAHTRVGVARVTVQ